MSNFPESFTVKINFRRDGQAENVSYVHYDCEYESISFPKDQTVSSLISKHYHHMANDHQLRPEPLCDYYLSEVGVDMTLKVYCYLERNHDSDHQFKVRKQDGRSY